MRHPYNKICYSNPLNKHLLSKKKKKCNEAISNYIIKTHISFNITTFFQMTFWLSFHYSLNISYIEWIEYTASIEPFYVIIIFSICFNLKMYSLIKQKLSDALIHFSYIIKKKIIGQYQGLLLKVLIVWRMRSIKVPVVRWYFFF